MNDPRESMEGAPLLGTPKAAYSNVPKRLRDIPALSRLSSPKIQSTQI